MIDLLVFGAHPDDAEIGMAGTIRKHAAAGCRVGICDLTRAELSSNGDPDTRAREAADASAVLGLAYRSCLGLPDRGLRLEPAPIDAIVEEIRKTRPRVVFAPYWEDRHPDHVQCSLLVKEALFNAKLRRYRPEWPAWDVPQFYCYFINDTIKPDLVVDVTYDYEEKRRALRAYPSQFAAPSAGADIVSTPLNKGYLERVEARDALLGQAAGCAFAEGFVSPRPYRVDLF